MFMLFVSFAVRPQKVPLGEEFRARDESNITISPCKFPKLGIVVLLFLAPEQIVQCKLP